MSKPKTKRLPLTRGQFAIVDAEDYPCLSKYNWQYDNTKADAYCAGLRVNLRRFVLNASNGVNVVPINGNRLDCRKENLLIADNSFRTQHSRLKCNKITSKFKGVSWHKLAKKWLAQIAKDGIRYYLGLFDTEEEAALAYDEKARELFGDFAYQNFNNSIVSHKPQLTPPTLIPQSSRPSYNSSTGFKGVSCRRKNACYARIRVGGKCIYSARFATAIEAAKAYDKKAKELFGGSAYLNFPDNKTRRSGPLANGVPAGRNARQRRLSGR